MLTPLRFFFAVLLALAPFQQEAPDDGSLCSTKAGTVGKTKIHECHCRLTCGTDDDGAMTYGEDKDCKRWCKPKACQCHPEPEPKDCAPKSGGHEHSL